MADETQSSSKCKSNSSNKSSVVNKKSVPYPSSSSHALKKRAPPRVKRPNDIYVTNKSNFKGLLSQCDKIIEEFGGDVAIHGIGAAIPKTINLALQLKEKHLGAFDLSVETSTVTLVDDLEPLTDEADYESRTRQNSAVCVRLVKNNQCPVNQL